jgi:hypothetical protein
MVRLLFHRKNLQEKDEYASYSSRRQAVKRTALAGYNIGFEITSRPGQHGRKAAEE